MAWYDVTYKCGHVGMKALNGSYASRDSYINWAKENKLCPQCEEEKMRDQFRKENETAEKSAIENGYVELSGSEKQVAWANSIRSKALECVEVLREKLKKSCDEKNASQDVVDRCFGIVNEIRSNIILIDSAKYFIDHYRGFSIEDVKEIAKIKEFICTRAVVSDEEFKSMCIEYDIAKIEHRPMANPIYKYVPQGEVYRIKNRFPEHFKEKPGA